MPKNGETRDIRKVKKLCPACAHKFCGGRIKTFSADCYTTRKSRKFVVVASKRQSRICHVLNDFLVAGSGTFLALENGAASFPSYFFFRHARCYRFSATPGQTNALVIVFFSTKGKREKRERREEKLHTPKPSYSTLSPSSSSFSVSASIVLDFRGPFVFNVLEEG